MFANAPALTEAIPPPFDVVKRGFDRGQVLAHLRVLSDRIRELEMRLASANGAPGAATTAQAPGDRLEGVPDHLRAVLAAFDDEVARQRRKAELEATMVVAEARTAADQMRLEAQNAHEEAVAEARRILVVAEEEATTVRTEAATVRESAIADLRTIQDRMRKSLDELETSIDQGEHEIGIDQGEPEHVILLDDAPAGDLPPIPQESQSGT
ncbi:MAG TPA: hypothetical protein VF129_07990 [Actinomycetota bacterium]